MPESSSIRRCLGHAEAARDSYEVFSRLKREGVNATLASLLIFSICAFIMLDEELLRAAPSARFDIPVPPD